MEPAAFCLALGPLGVYLLALAAVNLARRPVVTTGSRETAAMGLALLGFAMIGPMQLFFPRHGAARYGSMVWVLLVVFYLLWIALWILVARPRIVIYNVALDQVRPKLEEIAARLDSSASWSGNHLRLPERNVELNVEEFGAMRNVSLLAAGGDQSATAWQRLAAELRRELATMPVARNPRGFSLLSGGLLICSAIVIRALSDPSAVVRGFYEMLRP